VILLLDCLDRKTFLGGLRVEPSLHRIQVFIMSLIGQIISFGPNLRLLGCSFYFFDTALGQPGECGCEMIGIATIGDEDFYQVLEGALVCVSFGPAVACGASVSDGPCGFVELVGYFLVHFFVLQAEGLYEVEEDLDEL
jgi:hypothetical protein